MKRTYRGKIVAVSTKDRDNKDISFIAVDAKTEGSPFRFEFELNGNDVLIDAMPKFHQNIRVTVEWDN